jgi:DNA mismatch repair protein MutL
MSTKENPSRRIKVLRESVARKIAAGEVIDRPFSVVRELMDNALDAGARSVDLYIEQGGLKRIRLVDDGFGMSREDLEICFLPHATSKIDSAEDIYRLQTLGFRGEALSSIAACSKLTLTSAMEDSPAYTLEVRNGAPLRLELSPGSKGTAVEAADLFYSMPGRRKFLKSAGAESAACKRTFLEKTLPFPEVEFRFFTEGQLKLYLPVSDLKTRVFQAYRDQLSEAFLTETGDEGGQFRFRAVLSSPARARRDRRMIHIYLNKRRIQEFSLVQAVQYAYGELLPGGSFPEAFVFLDIDPELVDFNIHPAKREAKIKNLPQIHHQLVHSLKKHLNSAYLSPGEWQIPETGRAEHSFSPGRSVPGEPELDYAGRGYSSGRDSTHRHASLPTQGGFQGLGDADLEEWKGFAERSFSAERPPRAEKGESGTEAEEEVAVKEETFEKERGIRFLGQAFDLFLVVERGDQLYLIDQHAAHERIIYNRLTEGSKNVQQLLVPLVFEIEEDEERLLESQLAEYEELGISLEKSGPGSWKITKLPARFSGLEQEIVRAICEPESEASLKSRLFADLACKAAVKDGERLDPYSALELAKQALDLPEPRCPHGRPVWLKLSRNELFKYVGRT